MITNLILTLYAGFLHAFETDHLLAVSNLVTQRTRMVKAIKDGLFWGFGHTSTLLLTGLVFLLMKYNVDENIFKYFEALVGVVLIFVGLWRFVKWWRSRRGVQHVHVHTHTGGHTHEHVHTHELKAVAEHEHSHWPAYIVGLFHGLAGSGALLVIVLARSGTLMDGLLYLTLFGVGSVGGMGIAAALFSLPFSKKYMQHQRLQTVLIWISAILCIGFGLKIVVENLWGWN